MDFNQLAKDLINEMVGFGISRSVIAKRLGISRQAFYRRLATNSFTTEDLIAMGSMSVTMCGGSVLAEALGAPKTHKPSTERYYIIEPDGDAWFVHYNNFTNLIESNEVAFGKTPQEALDTLIQFFETPTTGIARKVK